MHEIFQRHGIPPDEVYAKDRRYVRFMYASMLILREEEEALARAQRNANAGRR